jgi:hypothetical protein
VINSFDQLLIFFICVSLCASPPKWRKSGRRGPKKAPRCKGLGAEIQKLPIERLTTADDGFTMLD